MDTLIGKLSTLSDSEREQWLQRFARELDDAGEVYLLSDEERALISEGLADLDAGRIVPDAEMERFWQRNRHG